MATNGSDRQSAQWADPSISCATRGTSSSAYDECMVRSAHDFVKKNSKEKLRSIFGAFLSKWEESPAWYYRVGSVVDAAINDNEDALKCLPKLSSVLGMSDDQSNSLLIDCELLRKNKSGVVEFPRNNWEIFRDEYDLDIEFDRIECKKYIGTNKRTWVLRVGSYAPRQAVFDAKQQAKKVSLDEWTKKRTRMTSEQNHFCADIASHVLSREELKRNIVFPTLSTMNQPEQQADAVLSEQEDAGVEDGGGDDGGGTTSTASTGTTTQHTIQFGSKDYTPMTFRSDNNRDQVLLRVPKSSSEKAFKKNMGRTKFFENLLTSLITFPLTVVTSASWLCQALATKFPEVYTDVAKQRGFMTSASDKMDCYSAAAMWEDANINISQQRSIQRHLDAFFGKRFIVPERKVREIGKNALEATIGHFEGDEKARIDFWYKRVDLLLQHDIHDLVSVSAASSPDFFKRVNQVDLVVGGDHGKGKFRMVLMVLLRTADPKETIRKRYIVGEIDCKKDTYQVLKETFMAEQNEAMKTICLGKRFIVTADPCVPGDVRLNFSSSALEDTGRVLLKNAPVQVFVCGDLAFYATVLGKENMSSIWCWRCKYRKREWVNGCPGESDLWTIERMEAKRAERRSGAARCGMVNAPLWDFAEPSHYLFPVLHVQIGLINDIIDFFNGWIDERIESLSDEEIQSRNARLMADIAHEEAEAEVERWNRHEAVILLELRKLKQLYILAEHQLNEEQAQQLFKINSEIAYLEAQLEAKIQDIALTKRAWVTAKKADDALRKGKKKVHMDVRQHVEHAILSAIFKISRARYHGGKFNGVDARRLMASAQEIMSMIETYLLSLDKEERRADDKEVKRMCNKITSLLQMFDAGFAILRLPSGVPTENDYTRLQTAIQQVDKIWKELGLSYTPKYHGWLHHARPQMMFFGGFGDMLEDEVEKSHQDGDRFAQRVARLKSLELKVRSYSHHEKTVNNPKVQLAIKEAMEKTSRKRKEDDAPLAAKRRSVKAKTERDVQRFGNLVAEQMRLSGETFSAYQTTKAEYRAKHNNYNA